MNTLITVFFSGLTWGALGFILCYKAVKCAEGYGLKKSSQFGVTGGVMLAEGLTVCTWTIVYYMTH